jgi:hypothetical protein
MVLVKPYLARKSHDSAKFTGSRSFEDDTGSLDLLGSNASFR